MQGLKTRAVRDGEDYVITSIIMVETANLEGYRVGRILDKMGMKAQDTAELFFENVRVTGYGYMNEYIVCRMFADSRVQRIYGGTNEIMKEVISRAL